ncbi:TerD family protein [Paenibacillus sp. CGMCC 1.16610]|uniref:Cytoplasmic protein n=1 Tax=Paenibacillus anseongense TaxID=2682845 RepID=A0ABW9TYW9_9BACL|nr:MULTISPECIES: TerD family protein [Paenibacillus]MBA2943553.1 TerD family protein [Paenibacillus sp. CGMCC 1.16610]MVQ33047.1 cytoplasmic protein [Paenibacillus anseongense]
MRNTVYLRRSRKLIVHPGHSRLPRTYIATAMKNIEYLGFTFSKELVEVLQTLSIETFTELYHQLVMDLKSLVGANVSFKPMYPNFPKQVMLTGEAELYLNAILHYLTFQLPEHVALDRFPLLDQVDLETIDLGSPANFDQSIRNLIEAKGSISETDKEDIEWVISTFDDLSTILPDEIPMKENVGFVVGALLTYQKANIKHIAKYMKTATDVLRLAVALSDGDVSLATNTKFRKFKRPERRLLLELLEQCGNRVEDMLRYKNRWIRLGEILHPADYKNKYEGCKEAFDILRNNKPFETFGGRVEHALRMQDTRLAADLLKNRAGEFARRLDHLLRINKDFKPIVAIFAEVAGHILTPVLLQVMAHFGHRKERHDLRTFFPKGNVAKAVAIPNTLPEIEDKACEMIVQTCKNTLMTRFAELPSLGDVYVDARLKQYVMPFSQRSASKALRTIVRGSRLEMPEGDTIRFFLWWKEGTVSGGKHTGRVDIDLSAVMYDEQWQYIEHISYTNLRSYKYNAAHSGDITSAPFGACEFIDLDIPSVIKYGGRYVVASLNAFTEQPYCDLPECFAGWMMRKHPNSGEIFEPSTVMDRIDIAADTRIAIPVILDLVEREIIWCDLALQNHPNYYNNVEGNQKGMVLMGKAMTSLIKPNLHDLFMLHAAARGRIVEDADSAQTVFSVKKGITPFDISKILAEFIA